MGYEIGIIGFSSVPSEPQFANFFCRCFREDIFCTLCRFFADANFFNTVLDIEGILIG